LLYDDISIVRYNKAYRTSRLVISLKSRDKKYGFDIYNELEKKLVFSHFKSKNIRVEICGYGKTRLF
jgi:hypothetical protein